MSENTNIKILFLGTLFRTDKASELMGKRRIGIQNQVNQFQWNLIDGFDSHIDFPVSVISSYPVGTFPNQYKQLLFKRKRWEHAIGAEDYTTFTINLPFIKQISRIISTYYLTTKWMRKTKNDERRVIVVYSYYLPYLISLNLINKNVPIIQIVTDLPGYDRFSGNGRIKTYLYSVSDRLSYIMMKRTNAFVLLTEQMVDVLRIENKPYIVMEGIINSSEVEFSVDIPEPHSSKKILYAGTLSYSFGIKELIKAFSMIEDDKVELHICGEGEAKDYIISRGQQDNRIKYHGFLKRDDVEELIRDATILINPRPNNEEFTKYSFPSKTMEYLLSGKPVIMYKLDGIPDEYDKFLFYVEGNEPKDLAKTIEFVLNLKNQELHSKGKAAVEFIRTKKNNSIQTNRILEMIKILQH